MKGMAEIAAEKIAEFGKKTNEIKNILNENFDIKLNELKEKAKQERIKNNLVHFGDDETTLLYHTESTILFARNALDVVATIFHCIAFHERNDSFNKFTKKILKDENDKFIYLKSYLCEIDKLDTHAFRLLCGSERGRSLRDQIVHQTNIKHEYDEYKEGSNKEKIFIVLYKGEILICYRVFMRNFVMEVVVMISSISQKFILDELENQL